MSTNQNDTPTYAPVTVKLTSQELWLISEALPRLWSTLPPRERFAAKDLWMRIEELLDQPVEIES
jgi:hypothetical protein